MGKREYLIACFPRPSERVSHQSSHSQAIPAPPASPLGGNLRRMLWLLIAVVLGLSVAATALHLSARHSHTLRQAVEHTGDGAKLMEEHFRRVFRVTDFVLRQVAALPDGRPFAAMSGDKATWQRLVELTQGLPEPGQLFLIDAVGQLVLGTREFPGQPTDNTDRAFFHAHRDQGVDFFVGPMVSLKNVKTPAFHVTRAIRAPDGNLLGIAGASFEAQSFTNFYSALSLGKGAIVGLYGMDGRIILCQPQPEQIIGKSIAGGPLLAAGSKAANGIVREMSELDGLDRLISYRSIREFGTLVGVAVVIDEVMASWRRDALTVALLLALAGACVAWTSRVAFRALGREEAAMHGLEKTVRERTEEANHQTAEARRANESKTKFLAAASHDLRQPLQAAGMFVEILAVRLAGSPNAPIVDKLRQSVDATQTLLSTLLDVSTLEAGQVEAAVTTFPVAPLMANLIDQMEPQAAERGLALRAVPTSARVVSDPILLERMLRNLLVNAIRYTDRGGVLLGCRRQGDMLALSIVDTGCGIPADMQTAIFDDFTRLSEKAGQRGLGLGLGVVRRMAELLRHQVTVRSVVGKGSCFTVLVPLA